MSEPNGSTKAAGTEAAGAAGSASTAGSAPKAPQGNPALRMMGLPNIRMKLPSRNWMIFWTVIGAWAAAVVYDRREKRKVQKKWCDLVSHLQHETIDTSQMPRRLTIYLSAPPADGLLGARDHFHEYVKPILVAAATDWDAVEGRREGDLRAGLAEKIRKLRAMKGESTELDLSEDLEVVTAALRERSGIREWDGVQGDIVIGRNTWKEYVRGLHEGWLGPVDPPKPPEEQEEDGKVLETMYTAASTLESSELPSPSDDDASPTASLPPVSEDPSAATPADEVFTATPPTPSSEQQPSDSKPKKKQPPPFISPAQYSTASLSPNTPPELPPANVIPFPHVLGFLKTPLRIWRFLNKRQLADDIGRQTAAAVLAAYRPFEGPDGSMSSSFVADEQQAHNPDDEELSANSMKYEQQRLLYSEEEEWHKTIRNREKAGPDEKEQVWTNEMVLDPRIAERMRRFVLDAAEETRAQRIYEGKEKPLGPPKKEEDSWW